MPQPHSLAIEPLQWEGVKDPQELRLIEDAIRLGAQVTVNHDAIRVLNIHLLLHRFPVMRYREAKARAVFFMRNLLEQITDETLQRNTDNAITQAANNYLA